ncbi:hypothetical protein EYF80_029541 [Liparis tanakae]|uniref:Secreted protein n=1 Tax=Liparis tanakae TaxID=230148 RepID=A0A4Z2H324_9TELE|nr:hypothetical protein EYF80_029541 [Liparis tanakae]
MESAAAFLSSWMAWLLYCVGRPPTMFPRNSTLYSLAYGFWGRGSFTRQTCGSERGETRGKSRGVRGPRRWNAFSLSRYSQQMVSGGLPRQTLTTRNTCRAHIKHHALPCGQDDDHGVHPLVWSVFAQMHLDKTPPGPAGSLYHSSEFACLAVNTAPTASHTTAPPTAVR